MAFTKVTGTLVDIGDLDLTNVGQIQLDSIAGDADANTSITFSGSDVITIATGGSGRLTIGDGALSPVTDNQIDLGTSSLEFKDAFFDGTVTTDALIVDDITIDGSTISDSGEFTIDCGSTIVLDADSGQISFKDAGTEIGVLENSSSDFKIESKVSDKDIVFAGNDGGTGITAMTIDMSEAGKVGIGTGSPAEKLHVLGDSAKVQIESNGSDTGVQLVLDGAKTSNGAVGDIVFENAGDSVAMIRANRASANDAADLLFYTQVASGANAEKFRITSVGDAKLSGLGDEVYMDIFSDSGSNRGGGYFRFLTDGASAEESVAQVYMEQGSGDGAARKAHMYFQVADNGNPATAMMIENNKVVTTYGDLKVTNDIIMLNNGRGISFAADTEDEVGAGSVGSELLHDYEEGTWTPDNGGPSFSTAVGTYTKIGNRVFCQFKVVAAGDGASTGDWSGLPFTIRNSSTMGIGGGVVGYHNAAQETWSISTENVNSTTFSIRRGPYQKQLPTGDTLWGTLTYLV
ncbi:hypothetical protein [uncultured Mediterranean phage]|nr:hypothetical protein [uncultured Mediterranean phage]